MYQPCKACWQSCGAAGDGARQHSILEGELKEIHVSSSTCLEARHDRPGNRQSTRLPVDVSTFFAVARRAISPGVRAFPLAFILLLGACQQVDYIEVTPRQVVLRQLNNTVWLQAHPMSHTGVYYPKVQVAWTVKDPSIARVDASGKVSPIKSGGTEVVAHVGDIVAAVPVEVLFAEKISVEPRKLSLREGQQAVEFHVKAYDYLGRELKDRTPTFRSLNQEVVSMGQNAAFPVYGGATEVEVQVDDLKQRVEVTVEGAKSKK